MKLALTLLQMEKKLHLNEICSWNGFPPIQEMVFDSTNWISGDVMGLILNLLNPLKTFRMLIRGTRNNI